MLGITSRFRCFLTALRAFHTAFSDILRPYSAWTKPAILASVHPMPTMLHMVPSSPGPRDVPLRNGSGASNMPPHPGHPALAITAVAACTARHSS
ncbi:MAG: hypothetical protein J4F28_05365 [Nitrosopumilaceae archaeon]|nr:hypothetical protein [Nitrosopumilaceae archaeon]